MSPESLVQLSDNLRSLYIKTAQKVKGSDRRQLILKSLDILIQTISMMRYVAYLIYLYILLSFRPPKAPYSLYEVSLHH
jgi:hypothetical protein